MVSSDIGHETPVPSQAAALLPEVASCWRQEMVLQCTPGEQCLQIHKSRGCVYLEDRDAKAGKGFKHLRNPWFLLPKENSKLTPPVPRYCPVSHRVPTSKGVGLESPSQSLAAQCKATGREQQAGSLLHNNPSCFNRSKSCEICRYRHPWQPSKEAE